MISAKSSSTAVRSYASQDPVSKQLSVFIVNTSGSKRTATVALNGTGFASSIGRWVLHGTSATDLHPTFAQATALKAGSGGISVPLSAYSVTILTGASS
jgi:hypothetical protein